MVASALSGEPVSQARIILRSLDGREVAGTITGADGRFALNNVDPGKYHILADCKGYVRGEYGARRVNQHGLVIGIDPQKRIVDANIPLVPLSAITGRIVDENRNPLDNAEVYSLRQEYSAGRQEFSLAAGATTNDLGEFRLRGLSPGRYWIAAIYRPEKSSSSVRRDLEASGEDCYVTTYYPGASELSAAAPINVAPGKEERGIEFSLLRRPATRICGRVSKAAPCDRPSVMLAPRDSGGMLNTRSTSANDSTGEFEIRDVPSGTYTLLAQCITEKGQYRAARPVEVRAGALRVPDLILSAGMDIPGRVRSSSTEPLAFQNLRIQLEPRDSRLNFVHEAVKDDGSFKLTGVAADTYSVALTGAPEDFYVKSIMVDGSDIMDTGFTLHEGQTGRPVELLLSPGAQLEGIVTDERQNIRAATVVLIPEPGQRGFSQRYKVTETDQFGRFAVRGVAPGEYRVFAWEDPEYVAYKNPDFIARLQQAGEPVHVRENENNTVRVRLTPNEQ